jgi:hypothetical protein
MKATIVTLALLALTGCTAHNSNAPKNMPTQEEMMKLSSPGDQHAKLQPLIGKWKHTVRWRMEPNGKEEVMTGTNVNRWVLGKRFMMQEVRGSTPKMPFEGIGYTGYDNVRGQYVSTWLDSMGTGMMNSSGAFDEANNAITESGTFSCPMTGNSNMQFRSNWKVLDKNHHVYEMFIPGPDGKEFKSMEIEYTRVGKA